MDGDLGQRGGRRRDILPLPRAFVNDIRWSLDGSEAERSLRIDLVKLSSAASNWMHAGGHGCSVPSWAIALYRSEFQISYDKY